MPITNMEGWNDAVKANTDGYSNACIAVARRVMELLDEDLNKFDCHNLISQADDDLKTGGITLFMMGAVANLVSQCHSRGEEFRRQWNRDTIAGTIAGNKGAT